MTQKASVLPQSALDSRRARRGNVCLAAAGPDRAARRSARPWPDRAPETTGSQREPAPARRQPAHARGHAGVGALATRARRSRPVRGLGPRRAADAPGGPRPATDRVRAPAVAPRGRVAARQADGPSGRRLGRAEPARKAAAGIAQRPAVHPAMVAAAGEWQQCQRPRGQVARRGRIPDGLAARQPCGGGGRRARHRHHPSRGPERRRVLPGHDFVR